ncbi:hypothetical protein DFH06DRAFT_1121850 [Mycena polygramma]|nr:hypothetical protein DFH06DRAFT_1121850 [Mycena polygramma]
MLALGIGKEVFHKADRDRFGDLARRGEAIKNRGPVFKTVVALVGSTSADADTSSSTTVEKQYHRNCVPICNSQEPRAPFWIQPNTPSGPRAVFDHAPPSSRLAREGTAESSRTTHSPRCPELNRWITDVVGSSFEVWSHHSHSPN